MSEPVIITLSGEAPDSLVTEAEYVEREARRLEVKESPFVSVDNEAQFAAALNAERSVHLRGEGSEGVVDCKATKQIRARWTTVTGPGHLQFSVPPAPEVRCLQVCAEDVTLRDFEFTSTRDLATSNESGINIPAYEPSRSHRLKIQHLDIHNWHTCVSKYGGPSTPHTDDVLIEDCYLHVFRYGFYLTFGLRRLTIRRTRALGKQNGETHVSDGNAGYVGSNTEDLLIEDSLFGECDRMGLEVTPTPGTKMIRPRLLRSRIVNVKSFGVSFGHCIQGYAENVIVDGAGGVGFEVAGDDTTGRVEDTILVACDVRNVTDPNPNMATAGYTIDKADDVVFLGCRASNITSGTPHLANGIYVYGAERAAILDCIFMDAGATAVHLFNGPGPNTGGWHVVEGCTFRHSKNIEHQKAVFVSNINTIVRHNTAFQRKGGTMSFAAHCLPGASVQFDGAAPVTSGPFSGSNSIISVPA